MCAFSGNWDYSVDEKGRLAIPSPLRRDQDGNEINSYMLTRGFEGTLWLFPSLVWQQFTQGLGQLNMANSEARYLFRMFFSAAAQCIPDKQGRITIPVALRQEVELGDQAFISKKKCQAQRLGMTEEGLRTNHVKLRQTNG